jgi:predicted aconitase
MVQIRSAQVSGASYKTIGEWGLKWLLSLDARACVPSVLNPVGMDRIRWEEMDIDPEFAKKQLAVISAYERLGISLECTCTPYYLNITEYGDHLAWSESSAVSYANSVIGARTNREGGPSALAAAIIGKTQDLVYTSWRTGNQNYTSGLKVSPNRLMHHGMGLSGTLQEKFRATVYLSFPAFGPEETS